jgi:hypothetical protein
MINSTIGDSKPFMTTEWQSFTMAQQKTAFHYPDGMLME